MRLCVCFPVISTKSNAAFLFFGLRCLSSCSLFLCLNALLFYTFLIWCDTSFIPFLYVLYYSTSTVSPTIFPSQALCVCREAAPSSTAGWRSIWPASGAPSVAMSGGTRMPRWFADSWARGETHTLCSRLASSSHVRVQTQVQAQSPSVRYIHYARLPSEVLTDGRSVMEIWWECWGMSRRFRLTHACAL